MIQEWVKNLKKGDHVLLKKSGMGIFIKKGTVHAINKNFFWVQYGDQKSQIKIMKQSLMEPKCRPLGVGQTKFRCSQWLPEMDAIMHDMIIGLADRVYAINQEIAALEGKRQNEYLKVEDLKKKLLNWNYEQQAVSCFIAVFLWGNTISFTNESVKTVRLCAWGNEFILGGKGSSFEATLPIGESDVVIHLKSSDGLRRSKDVSVSLSTGGRYYLQMDLEGTP